MRYKRPAHQEDARQVGIENAAPLFQREFDQLLPKVDARVVDQDVDAVEGSQHVVFELADLILFQDILKN